MNFGRGANRQLLGSNRLSVGAGLVKSGVTGGAGCGVTSGVGVTLGFTSDWTSGFGLGVVSGFMFSLTSDRGLGVTPGLTSGLGRGVTQGFTFSSTSGRGLGVTPGLTSGLGRGVTQGFTFSLGSTTGLGTSGSTRGFNPPSGNDCVSGQWQWPTFTFTCTLALASLFTLMWGGKTSSSCGSCSCSSGRTHAGSTYRGSIGSFTPGKSRCCGFNGRLPLSGVTGSWRASGLTPGNCPDWGSTSAAMFLPESTSRMALKTISNMSNNLVSAPPLTITLLGLNS
ncbi:hypothetical protein SAMN05444743_1821 [Pseudomonas sp. PDC86]|nr:hypothetical protein SAMN05444743_1821 [Pseudomonas sp. PDC86]